MDSQNHCMLLSYSVSIIYDPEVGRIHRLEMLRQTVWDIVRCSCTQDTKTSLRIRLHHTVEDQSALDARLTDSYHCLLNTYGPPLLLTPDVVYLSYSCEGVIQCQASFFKRGFQRPNPACYMA